MAEVENASDTETESCNDEEIEPKFKYQRILNELENIFKTDVVTCCAVHTKFLLFGTYNGYVYVLDHQGRLVNSNFTDDHNELKHRTPINYINIDVKGDYYASCSDDGLVNIRGLFSYDNNQSIQFNKSVKSVVLDPDIKSPGGKRFIVGDENLTLYEKNFLKKLKATVLTPAESNVLSICWNGQFVAWASCLGVRVYDLSEKCSLGLMKWENPPNSRLSNFRCNFRWSNATTLLIGWVDTIRICVIRKRNSIEVSSRDLPGYIVDPVSTFQTLFYISGLAPLHSNQLVVLGYPKGKDADHKALRPVLSVMEYKLNSSEEICIDSLSIRGFQEYSVNDYHLDCIVEECYYIVAPKDIVVASVCSTEDRVKWLTEHLKFEEALKLLGHEGGDIEPVTRSYVNHLVSLQQFEAAAKICQKYSYNNKSLWEVVIYICYKHQQLRSIGFYLPTSQDCQLQQEVYELVLNEYLEYDSKGFLTLLKEWPSHLYRSQDVINAVKKNFRTNDSEELYESLAILYIHQQNYACAFRFYLKLQNKAAFDLIRRYDLYDVTYDVIVPLIELDRSRAMQILLDQNRISPDTVVKRLEKEDQKYLYIYLDALDKVDGSGKYDEQLIELYARYERSKLLQFLKRSHHYNIQKALEICERVSFYPEMVYLLGKMGNISNALDIIINKVHDIDMAIEFCKEHKDSDLWNALINESIEKPDIIIQLLDGIVGYYQPEDVIKKIKEGQKIRGLPKALTKLLWDCRLQDKIKQAFERMDCRVFYEKQAERVRQHNQGSCITYEDKCAECQRNIINKINIPIDNIILYNCGHYYHEQCNFNNQLCKICKEKDDDEDNASTN